MIDIYTDGIKNIYEKDIKSQTHFLNVIAEGVRGMKPDILLSNGAFFIPNDNYLTLYFNELIRNPSYGYYDWEGNCLWKGRLVLPIKDLKGKIVGLVGYDPTVKLKWREFEEKGETPTIEEIGYSYVYSNKNVFTRGRYLFYFNDIFRKALREDYIILVDGVFDCINLIDKGFNAVSVLGSFLTDELLFQLSFIKRIYVIADNDDAGRKLVSICRKKFTNVAEVKQGICKDVDELLTGEYCEEFCKFLKETIEDSLCLDTAFRPSVRKFTEFSKVSLEEMIKRINLGEE